MRRFTIQIVVGILAIALWILLATPGLTQSRGGNSSPGFTQTAAVIVDGRSVFRVGATANLSAIERATFVNQVLAEELNNLVSNQVRPSAPALPNSEPIDPDPAPVESDSATSPHVTIDQQNQQTTLRVNGRYLLTITQQDLLTGIDVEEQAKRWRQELQSSLQRALLERDKGYLGQVLIKSVWVLLAVFLVQQGLTMGRKYLMRQERQSSDDPSPQNTTPRRVLIQIGFLLGQIGLWLGVITYITDRVPVLRRSRYEVIRLAATGLTAPVLEVGKQGYSILDLLGFVILVVGLWVGIRTLTRLLRTQVLQATGVDPVVQDTVSALVQYGLIFLGMVIILQSRGVDVSALTLLASVFGIGISLGLQNTANNFVSGLIIAFEKPIKRGDLVQLDDLIGTVDTIGPRSTRIYTLDHVSIIVPNSRFLDKSVINWSYGDPVSRLRVPVGVAYGSDITQVRHAILEAAHGQPDILRHPAPQVWFQEFGDSSLNFLLLVWLYDPRKQFKVRSELNYRIEAALRHYGVEIPFPQRDIHLRSPQLEKLAKTWLEKNAPPEPELYYPTGVIPSSPDPVPPVTSSPSSPTILTSPGIDLAKLAAQMQGPQGVEIRDRRYGFTTYPKTFIGSEAVAWLMHTQRATHEAALQLGQRLLAQGWIHHVTDDHDFKDKYLFYRFYSDEESALTHSEDC